MNDVYIGANLGEICLLWSGAHANWIGCCPTAFKDASQLQTTPDNTSQCCKKSGKCMLPFIFPSDEAEENIGQKNSPDLPADRILIVSHEVEKLKRLLDFLEKYFYRPANQSVRSEWSSNAVPRLKRSWSFFAVRRSCWILFFPPERFLWRSTTKA